MHIKTTKIYLTPVRMAIINKLTTKCGEKGTLPRALLVGTQSGAATVESSVELPQKIKKGIAL